MLNRDSFVSAINRIKPFTKITPITHDQNFNLQIKWENHQPTKSFKVRGAFNKILALGNLNPGTILVAGSAGNHGQALALAARQTNATAHIFVPENTPLIKIKGMKALGAKVIKNPGLYGEAEANAIQYAIENNYLYVSAYNDIRIIEGAGTIGLEWLEQVSTLERILIPVGGGGLICGVGMATKSINPQIEIVGVLSEASPYLYHQFYYHNMTGVIEKPTITDGLAGAVEPGSITIDLIDKVCDSIIQVTETEVEEAISYLFHQHGEIIEGSGAVGIAAVKANKVNPYDKVTGVLISGGNIDPEKHKEIIVKNSLTF